MIVLNLTVPLPCPLNQLYRSFIGKGMRHPRQILSAKARLKANEVIGAILKQTKGMAKPVFFGHVSVSDMAIVWPDKRSRDIDCYDKQLFDCLVKAGVLLDDKQIKNYGGREILAPQRPGWIKLTITEIT